MGVVWAGDGGSDAGGKDRKGREERRNLQVRCETGEEKSEVISRELSR